MKLKKTGLLFFSFFTFLLLHAQMIPSEKYTSKNGLISDRITAIAQDDKGIMWFGSFFGICRYDGINFQKIDLPPGQQNKFVSCLLPVGEKIYAGFLFNGGLAEYSNGKAKAYFITEKDSASSNEFRCLSANDDGSILVSNSLNKIYQFKNGVFSHLYTLQNQQAGFIKCLLKDAHNNLWIGTEKGLYIISQSAQTIHLYFPNEKIAILTKNKNGRIAYAKSNAQRILIEGCQGWNKNEFINPFTYQVVPNIQAIHLTGTIENGIWILDATKHLTHILNSNINRYKVSVDLDSDINALIADRENNVWIANEPGLIKISNFNIQSFLFEELAPAGGSIWIENDSALWVSNSKSLYRIVIDNISKKKNFTLERPSYYGALHLDKKKNLWVGLWDAGIWKTKWSNGNLVEKKFFSEYAHTRIKAHALVEDSKGNIWIGGLNGIFSIQNQKLSGHFQPLNAAGVPAFITCMALDESTATLWLGDNASGIIKVKYTLLPNGRFSYATVGYITSAMGLGDLYIRSILFDTKKNLWVGTRSGGIYKISETSGHIKITNFNSAANLSCTRVTQIAEQDSVAVWFATCNGIYSYQHRLNKWHYYNTSNGLLNAEIFNIGVDAKNKIIWTLSAQGITKLQINAAENKVLPLINITGIHVLGKPDSVALLSKLPVRYQYSQNSLGFSFAGASFIDEKQMRYKYMLEGYDKEWSQPAMFNSVNYASLPAGYYTFKVLAANAKGQWSAAPAVFPFEIVQPVYRQSWFIFLVITLLLILFYVVRIQRLKQRYKIEKLRLTIARDLHDDIGSTLGSINILSQTATRKLNRELSADEVLPIFKKIGQSAENTLEAMDDIVWSINPGKDKVQDLVIRMREFAIPLLEAKEIEFTFDTEGDPDNSLSMNLRRNVFLIFKEAIYNILKHADATKVNINLAITKSSFSMCISDNGKGFIADSRSTRNGLKNINRRAKIINGSLKINSSVNGTTISFSSPIR